jgi:opacity protein-like surface antigen
MRAAPNFYGRRTCGRPPRALGIPTDVAEVSQPFLQILLLLIPGDFTSEGLVKKFLVAGSALVALIAAAPSMAADLGVRPVVRAPVYAPNDWSGFYIGAHAGWGWGHDPFNNTSFGDTAAVTILNSRDTAAVTIPGINSNGFVGGAQFGYNQQWGAWVGGLEIDVSGADVKGSTAGTATGQIPGVTIITAGGTTITQLNNITNSVAQSDNFHLLGSARGRIGWLAWPGLLLYGTGGLAWTRFEQSTSTTITNSSPAILFVPSSSSLQVSSSSTPAWEFGWAAGAGGEVKITDHWLFRVEYLHYDFGNGPSSFGSFTSGGVTSNFNSSQAGHLTVDVVRAGLSLRFGNGPIRTSTYSTEGGFDGFW